MSMKDDIRDVYMSWVKWFPIILLSLILISIFYHHQKNPRTYKKKSQTYYKEEKIAL